MTTTPRECRSPARTWLAAAAATLALSTSAAAQHVRQPGDAVPLAPKPDTSEAVIRLLEANYLTDSERKDLRIFHGQWTQADLDTPARLARAVLMAGALDDPSFSAADADPLDRADAALLRGDIDQALTLLADSSAARAARIRAEALAMAGKTDESLDAGQSLIDRVLKGKATKPDEIVEGVRILALRARMKGTEGAGGADFKAMVRILADVRDKMDRLYWPASLLEAELLADKDNPAEAQQALARVLELNPACARAWSMLGRMAVDAFDFDAADGLAARLDMLARTADKGVAEDPEGETDSDEPGSPWAAFIRTRAQLRLNDIDAASDALEASLKRFPHLREGLALRCAIAARRYDVGATERALAEFDALSPTSPDALFEVGHSLAEARQYDDAARYLSRAHDRQPTWPAPVVELGLLEIQAGRDEAAGDALRTATRLDPFNVRAANSLKLVDELSTYATVEGEHFIIQYKPGQDAVLAREMLAPLEANYAIVTGRGIGGIDYTPSGGGGGKTVIDLMPDHRWFGVRIAGMPRIHTIAASTGPVVAMEAPREGPGHLGTYDWVRVLRHEFTHTVTLARTRNRIPHWFTEASAVYLELAPRDFTTSRLLADALRNEALFDFTKINVAFVRPERPTDRALAYAQGEWMYEYILEKWGREAPLRLMDLYGQGVREESAFQSVLGLPRDKFMEEFETWGKEQVIAWGLAPKPGQPTIKELLRRAIEVGAAPTSMPRAGDNLPEITREMLAAWLLEYPNHPDALELAIDMDLKAAGGSPTADLAPMLEHYAQVRPVDPMPHRLLAKYYLAGGRAIEVGAAPTSMPLAIPHLEYLDAREQKTPAFAAELAKRYAAIGDWTKAADKAERATRLAPYDPEQRELAASVAIKRKDFPAAQRHLTALVDLEPTRPVHKERLEALRKLRDAGAK